MTKSLYIVAAILCIAVSGRAEMIGMSSALGSAEAPMSVATANIAPALAAVDATQLAMIASSAVAAPWGASVFGDIDQMSGWQDCGSCAGIGGRGATVPYGIAQNQRSPSIDGRSARFSMGGRTPYANALWWKQLGGNPAAHHFLYDLYFYYNNASAPQALEFDMNQSVNGLKYIFGTQCDVRRSRQWAVWDTANARWVDTGVPCPAPPTNTWNHLVIETERTGDNKAHFVSITLNGQKHYVNRYFSPRGGGGSELNVAFQMDQNYAATNYSVWLDKVKFIYW